VWGGENYVTNFWTQNQNPATNNGGAGTGEPWTATGPCSTCSSAPATPTGLAASGTTSSSTNLSWSAVPLPAGCSVSYQVLQGGISIATPPTTSDAVTGLTPSTTYGFTVVAPHRSSLFPTRWIHRHSLKLRFLTILGESQFSRPSCISHQQHTKKIGRS
jgi:hypothetical protein